MKIIIIGAGDVGFYLAKVLCEMGHSITVIEEKEDEAREIDEQIDAKVLTANGACASTLKRAHADEADFILAMTTNDSTNILACKVAKVLGTKYSIARIHHQTYNDTKHFSYELQFDIDYLINPEALCAIELAKCIRNPGRIAVESIARGEIEVQQVDVCMGSKLTDLPLKALDLGSKIRVGYIKRGDEIHVPTAESTIQGGDEIILVGPSDQLFEAKSSFDPESRTETKQVTLSGGTETAIMLTRLLLNSRFKIRIIESDRKICKELSEMFPQVTIIQGEGTSLQVLEEEQVSESDFFIACTRDDEDNIMTCIQAKRLGSEHVQTVINKPDYESTLKEIQGTIGIDNAVSPRNATVRELLRFINADIHCELFSLPGGTAKIIECSIPVNSPLHGRKVRDINWPDQCVIIGLLHKFRAKVPGADDTIISGDRLIVVMNNDKIQQFINLLD